MSPIFPPFKRIKAAFIRIRYLLNYLSGETVHEWYLTNRNFPSDVNAVYPENPLKDVKVFYYPFLIVIIMLAAPTLVVKLWRRGF